MRVASAQGSAKNVYRDREGRSGVAVVMGWCGCPRNGIGQQEHGGKWKDKT